MATEAQSAAFTSDLRKAEKHPALQPRPEDRPVWLWISAGVANHDLEILLYPPAHPDAAPLTNWTRAQALIYRGERQNGAWVAPPEFIGYLTATDARVIARILEKMDGDRTGEHVPGASVETLNV